MIRYGILGFGLHGDRRLMPGFARAKASKVTAISRRNLAKAQETAKKYGMPHAFDSKEALCRCPDVDAVFVSTPNNEHCADTLLALSNGKPVLCEKPMAMNAGEAQQMVLAAREAALPLGVAQVFRFERSTQRLRERIAAGDIGAPVFARSEFSYQGVNHPRRWLIDRAVSGGGPIADVGVHCIDALRFILNDEVVRVGTLAAGDNDSGSVEARAVTSLEFARGTLAAVLVSLRADYRTPLEIVGREGALRAENGLTVDHGITIELWHGGKVVASEQVDNSDAYAQQVDAFAATVENGSRFAVPGEEGWINQLILDAAYRSAATGHVEKVASREAKMIA